MGDLRNKMRKVEQAEAIAEANRLRGPAGWTLFHFDFNPRLTRRNLALGEAIRALLRVTGTRLRWWRCPVRGLSIEYHELPRTKYAYDTGTTYRLLSFSNLPDDIEAKKALVMDLLLRGIQLYRALPNDHFDQEVRLVRELLSAPPSIDAAEWLRVRRQLDPRTQPLLDTHQAELRAHLLLGRSADSHTGPVEVAARRGA